MNMPSAKRPARASLAALALVAALAGCRTGQVAGDGAGDRGARPGPPVAVLDEGGAPLLESFDRDPGRARLVVLVSPT